MIMGIECEMAKCKIFVIMGTMGRLLNLMVPAVQEGSRYATADHYIGQSSLRSIARCGGHKSNLVSSNPLLQESGERRTSAQQIKIPFEEIASSSSRSGLGAGRPAAWPPHSFNKLILL